MSQDEALRMAAIVSDGFSGPLGKMRDMLRSLAREGAGHSESLTAGFGKVTGGVRAAEQAVASGLNPALKTVGITSLTASGAILGIGAALRSFVGTASSLGELTRATGISAQTLRDFGAVAGKFNVTQDQVAQGAQTFADKMRLFSRGTGDLYTWILQQGRTFDNKKHFQRFAHDLRNTTDEGEKLRKALEEMENIKDPRERRIFSQQFFGSEEIAKLADGRLGKKLKDIFADTSAKLGPIDPKAIETAERFDRSLADLGSTMRKLGVTIGSEVLPYAERFTTWVDGVVSDQRSEGMKALREGLSGIKKELDAIDWAKAGEDGLAFLREGTALAGTLAKAMHEVAEAIHAMREGKGWEVLRRLDGASGPTARALAPLAGDDKIERNEQADALRGRIGTAKEQGAFQAELLKELEERGDKEGSKRLLDAMEANTKNLRSLEEALKNLVGQGGATVQQQSFGGAGTVGALIQKASLGGGGGGGYGGSTLGERLFGHPTGSNYYGDPYRQKRFEAFLQNRGYGAGGGGRDIGGGMHGRPFGSPSPGSGADRVGRALRGGGSAGDGGMPSIPDSVPMTDSERNLLGLILKYEGGGKNQLNFKGKELGLDPTTAKGYTAQGYFQMLNTNWRRLAPRLGITTGNAMASSLEDQTRVALALLREKGGNPSDWVPFNPRLRAAIARGERAPAGTIPNITASSAGRRPDILSDPGDDRRKAEGDGFTSSGWRKAGEALRDHAQARAEKSSIDDYLFDLNKTPEGQAEKKRDAEMFDLRGRMYREDEVQSTDRPLYKQIMNYLDENYNDTVANEGGFSRDGESYVDRLDSGARLNRRRGRSEFTPDRDLSHEDIIRNSPKWHARMEAERERRRGLQLSGAARDALQSAAGQGGQLSVDGAVNINVQTTDPKPRITSGTNGSLFREVRQNRGRQMQPSDGEEI